MASLSGNDENSIESTFPWLKNFNADCRKAVGCKSVKLLENLLTVYLQHISVDVKNCYLKPNRGSKLRKCMLEALLFFHMYYQEVKEPMVFQFYFMKMADLISMYLDMEIIAARRKKETTKKVVGRITSCLHVFLDKQISYMLDVVLKAKTATRANKELYTPVLGKLMTNIRLTPRETQLEEDLMYVRCLLAFKLWKKMCKSNDEKKKVTELALQKLTVPKDFLEKSSKTFASVLPRIPHKKRNSITLFFMQAKFNLKPACEEFMNVCLSSPSPDDKHMFFDQLDESPSIGVKADCNIMHFDSRVGIVKRECVKCSIMFGRVSTPAQDYKVKIPLNKCLPLSFCAIIMPPSTYASV
ncbi:hypothetical protein C0J52_16584 [Blattella germanica]|nr:hypothetical protein C0J52_16584 [Blattella germanica]